MRSTATGRNALIVYGLFPFALSNGAAKKIIAACAAIFHHGRKAV
jgi:hypothetical protein